MGGGGAWTKRKQKRRWQSAMRGCMRVHDRTPRASSVSLHRRGTVGDARRNVTFVIRDSPMLSAAPNSGVGRICTGYTGPADFAYRETTSSEYATRRITWAINRNGRGERGPIDDNCSFVDGTLRLCWSSPRGVSRWIVGQLWSMTYDIWIAKQVC